MWCLGWLDCQWVQISSTVQQIGALDSSLVRSAVWLAVHLTRGSVSDTQLLSVCVLSKGSRLTWSRNRICLSACPADQQSVCLTAKGQRRCQGRNNERTTFWGKVCVRVFLQRHSSCCAVRIPWERLCQCGGAQDFADFFVMILSLIAVSKSSVTECSRSAGRASGPIMSAETLKY